MLQEVITLSLLFLSFYNIYKISSFHSFLILSLTFFLHAGILSLYHDYFKRLRDELKQQRENIFLQSMKKVILVEEKCSHQCEICFEAIEEMEEVCKLNCKCKEKYYHEECIFQWFQKRNSCPFCRKIFNFQNYSIA